MDQVVLLLRNPRYAIPSYHTMRHELEYSTRWGHSFRRKPYTYTERPDLTSWQRWRNGKWFQELNKWCVHLDFWMEEGLLRNTTERGPEWDYHCEDDRHMDCHVKSIIQFEKLYSEDEATGIAETLKLAAALDGLANVTVIDKEARPCIYREVMSRPEFYNKNRDGNGPEAIYKTFHYTMLWYMWQRLEQYREKYSTGKWVGDPNAEVLVNILTEYIDELQTDMKYLL